VLRVCDPVAIDFSTFCVLTVDDVTAVTRASYLTSNAPPTRFQRAF